MYRCLIRISKLKINFFSNFERNVLVILHEFTLFDTNDTLVTQGKASQLSL